MKKWVDALGQLKSYLDASGVGDELEEAMMKPMLRGRLLDNLKILNDYQELHDAIVEWKNKGFKPLVDWFRANGPGGDRDQRSGNVWQATVNSKNKKLISHRDDMITNLASLGNKSRKVLEIINRENNRELSKEKVMDKIEGSQDSDRAQGQYAPANESFSRGSLLRRRYRRY